MLRAFVAQSILHALVAGLLVEALLHAWRVEDGGWRLRFRLIALAEPVLVLPLLLLIPWRADASFAFGAALFATERWNALQLGGTSVGQTLMVCAAGVGAALFLRDAAPPLLDVFRGTPGPHATPAPVPEALADRVAVHARSLGIDAPPVRLLRLRMPVLLCEHVGRRPALVASTGTLARLDPDALDAAIAHELAHAAHRDPGWGYLLIAVRALAFFNPAVQWTARAAVDDLERRADAVALRLTARPDALASAIRTLTMAEARPPAEAPERFERLFWSSRVWGIERRCARILGASPPAPLEAGGLRLALAAAGIVGLLFFVV